MHRLTLKDLTRKFNEYNDDNDKASDMCEHYKNEWILENKDNYHFEELEEKDIINLRPYLKCWILSIYEYLAIQDNKKTADWFSKYKDEKCAKQDNDFYKSMKKLYVTLHEESTSTKALDEIFQSMLNRSIEPFKSRGITRDCIDDSV